MEIEVDTIYKCPKDFMWQHIKQVLPPKCIDMCIYKPCGDIYTTKKTIWNSISRIKENGFFCIECVPENISYVLEIISNEGLNYSISYFASEERYIFYIIVCKNNKYKIDKKVYGIKDWKSDIPIILTNMTNFGDLILVLGDAVLPFIPSIKQSCRHVIAFGGDDIFISMAKLEGIKECDLL